MMAQRYILVGLLCVMAGLTFSAIAQESAKSSVTPTTAAPAPAQENATAASATHTSAVAKAASDAAAERALRLEGEKRFRTNCGRCHQAPHKFPPRVMAAAIRHMRVRAMITDEDMQLILRYMTQ
ncbi:MAG TPA: cytochrome c [Candidatus Acidoferrum sp.]|nr:cytochrome c [Candidatus Acidoferrum sp.]